MRRLVSLQGGEADMDRIALRDVSQRHSRAKGPMRRECAIFKALRVLVSFVLWRLVCVWLLGAGVEKGQGKEGRCGGAMFCG
jgi:hypothetical protein